MNSTKVNNNTDSATNLVLDVATGKHRNARMWRNMQIGWEELAERCSRTHRTAETYAEYMASTKSRQDEIKDIGGFVAGYLVGGRRKKDTVLHRQILTLDADFAKPDLWSDFTMTFGCAGLMYSTHKHSADKPRIRILVPLTRPVSAEEYEPISRKVCGTIDIEQFDHTTHQMNRLMYWPSTSKDGEFLFDKLDGDPLDPDIILGMYRNWREVSEWPVSVREDKVIRAGITKQGDPLEKEGMVGLYCRAHTMTEILESELSDKYEACDIEDRWTFKEGSTSSGLVVYEDKFAYSNHGTDPVSGKLCNAFDLVRLHKFGTRDEDSHPDTPINRLPSYLAMVDYAGKDPEVRRLRDAERLEEAGLEFRDSGWMTELDANRKGEYDTSVKNIRLILENDELIRGRFGLNLFSHRLEVLGALPWNGIAHPRPWSDEDWSGLRCYLGEQPYNLQRTPKLEDVMDGIVKLKNSFHPVREYLHSQHWDGVERVERLFIDYLGAEDNLYVRAVTRKALIACVARVEQPGIKYDNVLTLVGKQGTGKSTILKKLGGDWFSDNFSFHMLSGGNGKHAQEQIQGIWIIEIGEMAGMRKVDVEAAKSFLSAQQDEYRPSYGREKVVRKRQMVPFGTSNDPGFLKSAGGNRRFWPVDVYVTEPIKDIWEDLSAREVGQIWAEAMEYYREGEVLHLSKELEEMAYAKQADHTERDPWTEIITQYLDTPIPSNWAEMDSTSRINYYQNPLMPKSGIVRDRTCVSMVWREALGGQDSRLDRASSSRIKDIIRNTPGWVDAKNQIRIYGSSPMPGFVRIVDFHGDVGEAAAAVGEPIQSM